MSDFLIFGVPAMVLVTLLVELLKKFNLVKGNWAIIASLGFGILFSVLNHLIVLVPGFEVWYSVVIGGIMVGLMASGLYDGGAAVVNKAKVDKA